MANRYPVTICTILFIGLIIFGGLNVHNTQQIPVTYDPMEKEIENIFRSSGFDPLNYEQIDSLVIDSDVSLESMATSEGWSGNGSAISPYIIEGYFIQSLATAVDISHTSLHFTITNCIIASLVTSFPDWNLHFEDVDNAKVNNSLFYSERGISVGLSGNIVFRNNTMIDQYVSFGTINSIHFLKNNLTSGSSLTIGNADYCNVTSNLIGGTLEIRESSGCIIHLNVLEASFTRFLITGLDPDNWRHDIEGNTLNGKPILYLKDIVDETFSVENSYAQVILGVCDNVTIRNGHFTDNPTSIMMGISTNCSVIDCSFVDCGWSIRTEGCTDLFIEGNSFKDNSAAISGFDSEEIDFINNEITGRISQDTGIFCQSNCIAWNITSNRIVNVRYAIRISSCLDFNITENLICKNDIGIQISSSSGFSIYDNKIGWNNDQATDSSSPGTNQWDDGVSKGNIWSDYSGGGFYNIPGDSGSVDNYPVAFIDDINPSILLSYEPTIVTSSDNVKVSAIITDDIGVETSSVSYTRIVDGVIYSDNFMQINDGLAEVTLQSYWAGANVTIIVFASDWAGNEANASVSFIVEGQNSETTTSSSGSQTTTNGSQPPTGSDSQLLMIVIGIAGVSVIVIVGLAVKMKGK